MKLYLLAHSRPAKGFPFLRFFALLVLAIGVGAALPVFTSATRQSNQEVANGSKSRRPDAVPGELIVRFRSDSKSATKPAQLQQLDVAGKGQITMRVEALAVDEIVSGLRLVHVASEDTGSALAALRARPDVVYAEPNFIRHALRTPNDVRYPQMWGLKNTGQPSTPFGNPGTPGQDIHAEPAWETTTGSKNVVVGIVDEGIDVNHEDLHDNIWTNQAEVAGNGIDDDGNGYVDDVNGWDFAHNDNTVFDYSLPSYPPVQNYSGDVDDHGTHVAGTVGATGDNGIGVVGVNWHVSLMSLKFLTGVDGFGTTADLLKALSYAKAMRDRWVSSGGTQGANIRVLNNSYGGDEYSQAELEAIRALANAGILFVVAAGNESASNDRFPTYPANYLSPNLISVAASSGGGSRASFSNAGQATVNMTAPGEYILSTTPKNTYDFFSGTSMATPHVSGAAALLCAAYPNISIQKLRSLLLYSGYVANWQYQYVFPVSSGRSLDANAALQSVTSADTTAPAAVGQFSFQNGPLFPSYSLHWTAPGDDGNTGKVAAYEVRFSESDLTDPSTFDLAIPLPGPVPEVAGLGQNVTVQIPWRHPAGFVAVRAVDKGGNKGPISSLPVPIAAGAGDPYVVTEGGPAALSTGGTPLALNVDDGYRNVSLPFALKFYEGTAGSVTVTSNGAIFVNSPVPNDEAGAVSPQTLNGYRMIAGLWDDLRTDRRAGDDIYVVHPDENRVIFRWQAVTYDTLLAPGVSRGENPVNFEVEIDSDGTIISRYGDGNHNVFPVVGLGGGWPEPYVINSHTSPEGFLDLTNAGSVTYTLRNPPPPPAANLSLSMTSGPNPVANGSNLTYQITAYNQGPYDAPNMVVTDVLPPGLTFLSCVSSVGFCTGVPQGSNGTVRVVLGNVIAGIAPNITIVAQVTAPPGSQVDNTVTVTSNRFDNDLTNNSASAATQVVQSASLGGIASISSAYAVNFAAHFDGSVWGWGNNDYGVNVLGDGNTSAGAVTNPVVARGLSGVTAVSTGGTHTLALKSDGTVWAWGTNGSGEGAGGTFPNTTLPVQVGGLANITAIAAGYSHSLALRNDGTVWAWGANDFGQLGIGSADNDRHPAPTQIPGLVGVISISAGTGYSAAVKSDGTVWTWGNNLNGQLGDNSPSRNSPAQVNGVSGVSKVAAGYNHVLVLKTNGTVMGWGMNAFGQTGSTNYVNVNPTPTAVDTLTGATAVAAGFGFSLALKSDGSVWGWGLNSQGQLGNGTRGSNPQPTPTQVSLDQNAVAIAAGTNHGLALLAGRTLRTWGDNTYGQLGDGTTFARNLPVTVTGVVILALPAISPASFTGNGPVSVTVSCLTPGAVLHYTTNGLDPTENDAVIVSGGTLTINNTTTLKVRAYKTGSLPSGISVGIYNLTPAPNPIDNTQTFVTQHYRDFLNREPDSNGLQFWINNIDSCGSDSACREVKRIDTSAAYFLSIEFQETGYLVHRFYRASFGRRPLFNEFLADTQTIGNGVVVNAPGWEQLLESNKQAFANAWVSRPAFTALYNGTSNAQYVDMLIANTGVTFIPGDRDALVAALNNQSQTRAQVLRLVAEYSAFYRAEYNGAFVEMQYFGYLRRNPQDPPDNNLNGYNFWLNKLNQFNGDFRRAEMVKAFLVSGEYRQRFGTP